MSIVSFTLSDEAVAAFQNALACILRFSEDVSLDASRDKFVLSALNSTKSAFVSFTFAPSHFLRYSYQGNTRLPDRFFCVLYIRALLSIFRNRQGGENAKGANALSNIERCDVDIEDGPGKKSRFVAKIAWRNGITATHALPFEVKPPILAPFDKSKATNVWSISAHTLRRLMEHFGPRVELLDINTEGDDVVNLACFTEKQYAKTEGVFNMNLHTSIAVKMDEFDNIDVQDNHHIIINVKDFRAILQHACTTTGDLSAHYSDPYSPLSFSYEENGMYCQLILTTMGNKGDSTTRKQKAKARASSAPKQPPTARTATAIAPANVARNPIEGAPPPAQTAQAGQAPSKEPPALSNTEFPTSFGIRPQPLPPPTIHFESLFDDDSRWEPVDPDEVNPEFAQIEWDESLQPELTFVPISTGSRTDNDATGQHTADTGGLEPTQRLTQVRKFGLFD